MAKPKKRNLAYCFIDIDLKSRTIIGWGTEQKDKIEVHLSRGFHRVFLTNGQYNKLVKEIEDTALGRVSAKQRKESAPRL